MPNILDAQLRSLHQKQLKYSQYFVGQSEIKSAGDCGSHRHITWLSDFDFKWSLGYEKTICKMGATFAHNLPQIQSCDNFEGVFDIVQLQYGWVLAPFDNRGQNIDSPQQTRDQAAVKTVSFSVWISTEEGQSGLTANKVMVTVSWGACGIIHFDYIQRGRTINGKYYVNSLEWFKGDLKKNRLRLSKKKRFSTKTMQGCTHVYSPWWKFNNWTMNCSLIHPILRI